MEAACSGPGVRLDTLGVKSTLLAVTAGPHTVQSVSRFHTFTRTIAIVKEPQDAEARTRGRKLEEGQRISLPLSILIRGKKQENSFFFGFPSRRTSSLHLLFKEQEEEGRKGIRNERVWVLPRAESRISIV